MFKVNNKSTNYFKANICQDVALDFFAYIVIIAVYTFTCFYTNLHLLMYFSLVVSDLCSQTKDLISVIRYEQS